MSYEQNCADFAAFGDPMREHYDHEENARYDYVREAYGDSGDAMQDWMDQLDYDDSVGCAADYRFEDDDELFDDDGEFDFDDFDDLDGGDDWDDVPF